MKCKLVNCRQKRYKMSAVFVRIQDPKRGSYLGVSMSFTSNVSPRGLGKTALVPLVALILLTPDIYQFYYSLNC